MTERPILFSAPMVRAILDGRKTQTRRVIKPQPTHSETGWSWPWPGKYVTRATRTGWRTWRRTGVSPDISCYCPKGKPGDRLWVRETFLSDRGPNYRYDGTLRAWYRADVPARLNVRWTPSIHMPRWASRITLEVIGVRVEPLQDISEPDAKAEGVEPLQMDDGSYLPRFQGLWDSINAKRGYGWDANPWVWCLTFRRLD